MIPFVVRRALLIVPTLFVIATLTFFLVRLAPGGPFQSEKEIPKAALAQMQRAYGLDQPLPVQYVRFVTHAAVGDFGPSYKYPQRQVRDIIVEGFRVSAELGGWALLLSVLLGVPLGVIAAVKQNQLADHAAMTLALAGVSIPNFVLGPALVLVFSLGLYWLPPALWTGPSSRVLPVLTLSVAYVAYIARLTRAGMLEVLRADFVRTARAKGLQEWAVIVHHALRNALIPVVTLVGLQAAFLLGGAVVTETMFSWPGVGRLAVGAITTSDYPVAQGAIMLLAMAFLAINLLVDVLYVVLDPRVQRH